MQNFMTAVKTPQTRGSLFDMTHDVTASYKFAKLYPTLCLECVPGDKFTLSQSAQFKFLPMVAPIMHRIRVETHYFFVPNRLVWPNWQQYITNGGDNPDAVSNVLPAFPTLKVSSTTTYCPLLDHLDIPRPDQSTGSENAIISAIPAAVYCRIFDDYYRDQNLQDAVNWILQDGDNTSGLTTSPAAGAQDLFNRSWNPDLFTKSLPFAQKGQPVTLPLQDVEVKHNWQSDPPEPFTNLQAAAPSTENPIVRQQNSQNGDIPGSGLYADLSESQVTLNDLRTAMRLQEFLEKNARGGTRYTEILRAHFGVTPQDSRLQRAEYICGTSDPVVVSETLATAQSASGPQSNMSGNGMSVVSSGRDTYYCTEHGYIMAITSIMPETKYQQGIPKHFLKTNSPFELMWPEFTGLGEQPVQNQEIYAYTNQATETFGYMPIYYEYRYHPNRVRGDMRTTLRFWHLGRIFDNQPALNEQFLNASINRADDIFAAGDTFDYIVAMILHRIKAYRLLPKYGTPTF